MKQHHCVENKVVRLMTSGGEPTLRWQYSGCLRGPPEPSSSPGWCGTCTSCSPCRSPSERSPCLSHHPDWLPDSLLRETPSQLTLFTKAWFLPQLFTPPFSPMLTFHLRQILLYHSNMNCLFRETLASKHM